MEPGKKKRELTSEEKFRLFEIRVITRQLLEEDYFITRDPRLLPEIEIARVRIREVFSFNY